MASCSAAGTSICPGAQDGANVDQVAQDRELHRRAAGAVAAIRQDLGRNLALDRTHGAQDDPLLGVAERDEPGDQTFQGTQPPRTAQLPCRGPLEMAQLRREAHQYRAAQQPIGLPARDLVEMHDPAVDPCRQDVGAPRDGMPGGVVGEPTLHQRAHRVLGAAAEAQHIGDPGKAVPFREPVPSRLGRKPHRHRIAHGLAGEVDLAAEDHRAALGVSRPALANPKAQISRRPADQRVAIKRAGR